MCLVHISFTLLLIVMQCIPHVDVDVLPGLIPRLVEVLKSGVGLGTKVCSVSTM